MDLGDIGGVLLIILIPIIFILIIMVISWVSGEGISARGTGGAGIRPEDLPLLMKGISKGVKKLSQKTSKSINDTLSSWNDDNVPKLDKLEKLNHLLQDEAITKDEFEIMKKEILK